MGRVDRIFGAFSTREDGATSYFALTAVLVAIVAGGVAVDVARQEATRAKVQQTLDSCTEIVATTESYGTTVENITTKLNACLQAGGVPSNVATASATYDRGRITATANGTLTNYFMQMANISTLAVKGGATGQIVQQGATEVVLAVETSNVTGAFYTNVQTAATSFVDRFFLNDTTGRNTLALVPYNSGVNLPTTLLARFNVTNVSNMANSNCLDLDGDNAEFGAAAISRTKVFRTVPYADVSSSTSQTTTPTPYKAPTGSDGTISDSSTGCPAQAGSVLRLPSTDATTLKANISGWYTSSTASAFRGGARFAHAMNWSLALLDPSTRPTISPLMPTALNDRPRDYDPSSTQKVIVLVSSFGTGDDVSTGNTIAVSPTYTGSTLSPVWQSKAGATTFYSMRLRTDASPFWWPHNNTWNAAAYTPPSATQVATQLSWPDVLKNVREAWVSWQLMSRSGATGMTYTAIRTAFRTSVSFAAQVTQLSNECTEAKRLGITIYAVAVNPNSRAVNPLQSCATSADTFFNVSASNLAATLTNIAAAIRAKDPQ